MAVNRLGKLLLLLWPLIPMAASFSHPASAQDPEKDKSEKANPPPASLEELIPSFDLISGSLALGAPPRCKDEESLSEVPVVRARPMKPLLLLRISSNEIEMTDELRDIERSFNLSRDHELFSARDGSLPTKTFINYERALTNMGQTMRKYPGLESTAHGSLLFHGAPSSALLAFTEYSGADKGKLIPTGQLLDRGRVPFGGALDGLATKRSKGINNDNISTVFFSAMEEALFYSGAKKEEGEPWHFDRSKESSWAPKKDGDDDGHTRFVSGIQTILGDVARKRDKDWLTLNPEEKDLVEHPFPVLFGLRPEHRNPVKDFNHSESDVHLEILVKNGFNPNEVKVIYVPQSEVEKVKGILEHSMPEAKIPVEAMESLSVAPSHN